METITEIREVTNISHTTVGVGTGMSAMIATLFGGGLYDGFEIVTTEQTIQVLISNGQSCCESWGYCISEDNPNDFIGSELISIEKVDEGLNTSMVQAGDWLDEGAIVFVNFVTNRGVFQIACYNGHNGYYGHEVHIISEQLIEAINV